MPRAARAALGVATLVSAGWQPRLELARPAPASAMRVLTLGWVPAMAPIAVLALALQMARYELALAFFAVLASVSVFGARLLVERYRQLRALEALRASLTERRRAEAEREGLIRELEARNAELERFSYTVSHDLKAPLVTIQGFLGAVEQAAERGDKATLRADMQRIQRASDRMQRLLSEVLDLSRAGRVVGPAVAVPLDAVAREAVANAAQELKQQRVAVEIAPGLPVVLGDRVRLVEVVQNLVANAARFMGAEPRPRVVIGSRGGAAEGQALVFVQDNGIGIDPRFHEQVFRLFDKLDPKSPGTGVGLALVKRIVEVHGGKVWVESSGADHGTTFCFTLPLAH
jgi:signal transduction histidine kinase